MNIERWQQFFREHGAGLPGHRHGWVRRAREDGLERFATLGWPSARQENWRHTSLMFLNESRFEPVGMATPAQTGDALAQELSRLQARMGDGHWMVFVDGRCVSAAACGDEPRALAPGVRLWSLAQAIEHSPELVRPLFDGEPGREVPAALNTAFATDGAVLVLDDGAVLEQPLHLVFALSQAGRACTLRNLVVAGAGASATVVEHAVGAIASDDGSGLSNLYTRLEVGEGARLTHLKLQQEPASAVHLAALEATQHKNSVLASHSVALGAALARNDLSMALQGEGCDLLMNGIYHTDGKRHVDHHTRIEHAQPSCNSREFYRGILDGESRGVFTGRIQVARGAIHTDAVQRTDSLLLSPRAEADARPELEIYADDVKCAHGATVGQLDETTLFYLRSRGIDAEHARNLLTYAFAVEALARIQVEPLRHSVQAALRARLPGGERLEAMT